jgi:anti-sigma regulatory factor (Ser/Thr protein kinase)
LIERRTRTIDVSIDDLVRVVGALDVGTDTDQMSDAILSECLTGTEQKDDVALVVVRRDLVDEAPRSPAPPTTRHERRFEPTRAAVSAAREFSAVAAGVSGTDRDDVELITSELVTNATLHGTGEVIVRIERGSSLIRIEVFDDGSDTPLRRHPEPHEEGGRGLGIVEMIADGWGVTHDTSGKWVWAELELSEGG